MGALHTCSARPGVRALGALVIEASVGFVARSAALGAVVVRITGLRALGRALAIEADVACEAVLRVGVGAGLALARVGVADLMHRAAGLAVFVLGADDGGVAVVIGRASNPFGNAQTEWRALFAVLAALLAFGLGRIAGHAAVLGNQAGRAAVSATFAVGIFLAVVEQADTVAAAFTPRSRSTASGGSGLGGDFRGRVVTVAGTECHAQRQNHSARYNQ